jgi:hypothetical protein
MTDETDIPDGIWDNVEEAELRAATKQSRICFDSTHPGFSGLKSKCPHPGCVVQSIIDS